MANTNLLGRVVVITGAAGRLGRLMVHRFAGQGATVAAIDLEAGAISLPQDLPGRVFSADMTKEEDVQACFEGIGSEFGRIDVLVHTVGGWSGKPLLETALRDWDLLMGLNLTSTFLCFREGLRLMQAHGGRLIGIAAGQGADRGRGQQAAYSAGKAGVIRLVEAIADEFGGRGITAHAIAPSALVFDEESDQPGVRVEHVVDLALYLCSPAGDALNGATLRVYGTLR
jgi:NAD(P)-dependent dehydrogenase (short-subunit alcohol dehydrogenase family)